jgi:hypothetical protein
LRLEVVFADEAEEAAAVGAGFIEIADGFFFFGVFAGDEVAAFIFHNEDSDIFEFDDEVGIYFSNIRRKEV